MSKESDKNLLLGTQSFQLQQKSYHETKLGYFVYAKLQQSKEIYGIKKVDLNPTTKQCIIAEYNINHILKKTIRMFDKNGTEITPPQLTNNNSYIYLLTPPKGIFNTHNNTWQHIKNLNTIHPKINQSNIYEILIKILIEIDKLQQHNIVHNDLNNNENILFHQINTNNYEIAIIDFDNSKQLSTNPQEFTFHLPSNNETYSKQIKRLQASEEPFNNTKTLLSNLSYTQKLSLTTDIKDIEKLLEQYLPNECRKILNSAKNANVALKKLNKLINQNNNYLYITTILANTCLVYYCYFGMPVTALTHLSNISFIVSILMFHLIETKPKFKLINDYLTSQSSNNQSPPNTQPLTYLPTRHEPQVQPQSLQV